MKINGSHTTTYLLIAILVVAAVLRFNHINQPLIDVFSWRQSSTAMMADNFYRKNWNIFYPEVSWTGPGPSYQGREFQTVSYISALLYVIFGQHDWVGRTVAVMFGLWGIFALYQLVRRVWDKEHALVSAAVMALLPGSIFIERSFLPDPVMVALVTTSFWLLVAYFQTDRLHYLLLASVIGIWGFLTKIPGLMVGIPMLYAMLTILGRRRMLHPKKLVTISIAAMVTLMPVVAYYLWARHLALSYPPYHFAGAGNWLWDSGLQEWWNQRFFFPQLAWHFNNWIWTKPVVALVSLGLLFPPARQKYSQDSVYKQPGDGLVKAPWLFHWWLLAGVIYYLIGAQELIKNTWNFHIINPAAAALAGHGIIAIASFTTWIVRSSASVQIPLLKQLRLPLVTTFLLLLIIGTSGQKALRDMYNPSKPWNPFEGYKLGLALRQIAQPGELVITLTNALGDPVAIYYSQRRGWVFPPNRPGEWFSQLPEDDSKSIRLFEELRAKGADWLGIVNEQKEDIWKYHPTLVKYIERTCKLQQESSYWVIYRFLTPEEMVSVELQKL